ncbi:MAG TPA: L,D-transpeptidase [Candidatus Saccharimonadales bacterium]|nr:L,D-transpeptidase [Candidatus Saccharimonadales bacterium]
MTKSKDYNSSAHLVTKKENHPGSLSSTVNYEESKDPITCWSAWLPPVLIIAFVVIWVVISGQFVKIQIGSSIIPASSTDKQLQNMMESESREFHFRFLTPSDGVRSYSLQDAGLRVDIPNSIKLIRERQSTIISRLWWWKPICLPLVISVNQPRLNNFIQKRTDITVFTSKLLPIKLPYGGTTDVGAMSYQRYGLIRPASTLIDVALKLDSVVLKLKSLDYQSSISQTQLTNLVPTLQKIISQPVSIIVAGRVFHPDPQIVAGWTTLSQSAPDAKLSIVIDEGKVQSYLDGIVSGIRPQPVTEIQIKTAANLPPKILQPGYDGYRLSTEAVAANDIATGHLKSSGVVENLTLVKVNHQTITLKNYPKWVEVNLSDNVLKAFTGTNLVSTLAVTSGKPSSPTPTGNYFVTSKYRQLRSLKLANSFSPVVNYVPWVEYFSKNEIIAGDYWDYSGVFGKFDETDGMIGLMPADAEWLYNWAPTGTPVVVVSND